MRHTPLALAVLLTLGVPLSSAAQETPRAEMFGGYSWARDDSRNMNGWNASVTLNLREWLGISTDISGLYTSLGNTDRCRYWVLAGPRVSLGWGRFTPFAYALAGAVHTRSELEFLSVSIDEGSTDPGMALGGGLGVRLSDRWSGEVKAEAALVRSGGDTDSAPRLSGGLVLRIGALRR